MSFLRGGQHRRRRLIFAATPVAVAAAGAVAVAAIPGAAGTIGMANTANTASATGLTAQYSRTGDWGTGYEARYTVANPTGAPDGFTLRFDLPSGGRLTSLWNATYRTDGQQVTVTPPSWQATIEPGGSVDVGFVVSTPGGTADPTGCQINGADCAAPAGPGPTSAPVSPAPPTTAPPATSQPSPPPSNPAPPAPTAPPTTSQPGGGPPPAGPSANGSGRFAPYVDTSLYPAYDLLSTAQATGVKDYTLAFVLAGGGGCTPRWGGVSDLNQDGVPGQIGRLRDLGGDVRVSFGGANGTELAAACDSPAALAAAYGQVISAYGLTKVDFDIEGAALANGAANTRRAQAVAQLQRDAAAQGRTLNVSFTLPVLPSGLTQDGVNLLRDAKGNGVRIDAVNVMAMDYGDGAAPNPAGRMGQYAIDAATATQAQVAGTLGLSDADAWAHVAVTPMIGVNDTATEVFTVADARQLTSFAAGRNLAWLAMWSQTRDQPCPGGAAGYAQPTCSSIDQQPLEFTKAFAAF